MPEKLVPSNSRVVVRAAVVHFSALITQCAWNDPARHKDHASSSSWRPTEQDQSCSFRIVFHRTLVARFNIERFAVAGLQFGERIDLHCASMSGVRGCAGQVRFSRGCAGSEASSLIQGPLGL